MSLDEVRRFSQVDVFGARPLLGNPVAVVLDGAGLSDQQMAVFAKWTNLSETTFLMPPSNPAADYALRIFTHSGELPFAGHPTLGSAHAWLEDGGIPQQDGRIIQECAAGLIEIRDNEGLAFAAPPTVRSGPLDESTFGRIIAALGITANDVVAHQWVDNGPGWAGVLLKTAEHVLQVEPDLDLAGDLNIGIAGLHQPGADCLLEVRAFCPDEAVSEDPVTGSLNASLAQWLIRDGLVPESYTASQGQRLSRAGRIRISSTDDQVWVAGTTVTVIRGTVALHTAANLRHLSG